MRSLSITSDSIRMLNKQGTYDETYVSGANISLSNSANHVSFLPDHIYLGSGIE